MKKLYILLFALISFSCFSQIPVFTATSYGTSSSGYYFLSDGVWMMVLDKDGEVVWYEYGTHGLDYELQTNGQMNFSNKGKVYLMDSTFHVIDSIHCQNLYMTDGHEFRILPNGHFLLLGGELDTMDLSAFYWNGSYGNPSSHVRGVAIQELDASRNVVFEWHAKDHFAFTDIDTFFMNAATPIDWTHANSLDFDYDGNLLLSDRHFDEITKINHTTGAVMWRLGGSNNQFTFPNLSVPFYGQHDIRRIANGHYTLFDDGNNITPHGARALEFELDQTNLIATLKWSYTYDSNAYSNAQGSVQRLANYNTVVNYGNIVNSTVGFVVIDSNGNKALEIDGLISYRALNYSSLPFLLHRPQINCFDSLGVSYLEAGAGYPQYKWNTGATSRIIPITAIGSYYVFVPYGMPGGYISSEHFVVTDLLNVCGITTATGTQKIMDEKIKVFPNPATTELQITNYESAIKEIYIYNTLGQCLFSQQQTTNNQQLTLDISNFAKGIYFVKINNQVVKFAKD